MCIPLSTPLNWSRSRMSQRTRSSWEKLSNTVMSSRYTSSFRQTPVAAHWPMSTAVFLFTELVLLSPDTLCHFSKASISCFWFNKLLAQRSFKVNRFSRNCFKPVVAVLNLLPCVMTVSLRPLGNCCCGYLNLCKEEIINQESN